MDTNRWNAGARRTLAASCPSIPPCGSRSLLIDLLFQFSLQIPANRSVLRSIRSVCDGEIPPAGFRPPALTARIRPSASVRRLNAAGRMRNEHQFVAIVKLIGYPAIRTRSIASRSFSSDVFNRLDARNKSIRSPKSRSKRRTSDCLGGGRLGENSGSSIAP